jgi:hypothetical protein
MGGRWEAGRQVGSGSASSIFFAQAGFCEEGAQLGVGLWPQQARCLVGILSDVLRGGTGTGPTGPLGAPGADREL